MRFPNIPFEIYNHLTLNIFGFGHGEWFDLQQSIKVFTLIIVTVESIVIFLRVELNNS